MKREYHKWYSPALGRDMELLIYGHAGARVLVFPTSKGRFYEWEDRGMLQRSQRTGGSRLVTNHLRRQRGCRKLVCSLETSG